MTRSAVVIVALVVVGLAASAAGAQQVEIKAPPPPRSPEIDGVIQHGLQYELTQPDDARYLPPGPRVHYDPAYIEPLSAPTETGRMGLAGWTAPTAAMGGTQSGARDITGYFAIGFAIEWGGPPAVKPRPR
jgi:hypothetical protein